MDCKSLESRPLPESTRYLILPNRIHIRLNQLLLWQWEVSLHEKLKNHNCQETMIKIMHRGIQHPPVRICHLRMNNCLSKGSISFTFLGKIVSFEFKGFEWGNAPDFVVNKSHEKTESKGTLILSLSVALSIMSTGSNWRHESFKAGHKYIVIFLRRLSMFFFKVQEQRAEFSAKLEQCIYWGLFSAMD